MKQPDRHSETDRVEMTQRGWVFLPAGYMLALIGWGLGFEPRTIPQGLLSIAQAPGLLVSDYLAIGGLGAAFVNPGLVALAGLLLSHFNDLRLFSSPTISAVFTMAGFGFFGKNWWSIWPISLGVALFSRVTHHPFKSYIRVALFGTALAPLVTQVSYGFGWGIVPGARSPSRTRRSR